MPLYITRGQFSEATVRDMVNHPEDREELVKKMVKSAGGKLLHYYVTQGDYDFMIISQFDNQIDGLTASLVAAGMAGVHDLNTVTALTTADLLKAENKAHEIAPQFASAFEAVAARA